MSALFRNPVFTRLFLANFASQLGTVVGNMAFAYYLVDHFSTRPALAATAELMYSLPTLAVFWLVGVIADLLDRARIAVYSDWIRAGLTLLLLAALHFGLLTLCFVLLFLRSAVAKFFGPAEMGLLQGSIGQEQYVQAAGLNQMVMGLFMLFGMSLGAFAYRFLGIEGAILIDGISFLLSGLLILSCRFHEDVRMPGGRHALRDIRFPRLIGDFLEGLRYILSHKLLLTLISGFLFFGIVNGVFAVLPIFTMKYKLSPDSYMLHASLITLCLGMGFLAGSLAASPLIRRFTRTRVLVTGLLLSSLLIVSLGSANSVWLYLPLVLIEGFCIAPVNIAIGSWLPELVIPRNMGRVNALIEPIMMLGHSLALGMVALAFPAIVSVTWLHYLLAVCTLLVCVYYAFALPPLVRRLTSNNNSTSTAERAS